jgi:hypothetical protein
MTVNAMSSASALRTKHAAPQEERITSAACATRTGSNGSIRVPVLLTVTVFMVVFFGGRCGTGAAHSVADRAGDSGGYLYLPGTDVTTTTILNTVVVPPALVGVECDGYDMGTAPLPASSAAECATLCLVTPGCAGYVFHDDSSCSSVPSDSCFLKSAVVPSQLKGCLTCGVSAQYATYPFGVKHMMAICGVFFCPCSH